MTKNLPVIGKTRLFAREIREYHELKIEVFLFALFALFAGKNPFCLSKKNCHERSSRPLTQAVPTGV